MKWIHLSQRKRAYVFVGFFKTSRYQTKHIAMNPHALNDKMELNWLVLLVVFFLLDLAQDQQ